MTIVLPVHNGAETLPEALHSISQQTYRDWRLVVVDDGSTDGSAEVVARHFRGDRRVRLVRTEHRGVAAAANLALREADTEWVARMDADDLCMPERLEVQLDFALRHPEVDVVAGQVESFAAGGIGEGFAHYDAWQNALLTHEAIAREAFVELPVAHPTLLMRRRRILAVGGYRAGDFPEDYEFFLRALARGLRFGKVQSVVLRWRDHPHRATRTDPRYREEAFLRVKATYLAPRLRGRPLFVWGGRKARRLGRLLAAEGAPPSGWVDVDPRKRGQRSDGLPFLEPGALPPAGTAYVVACVGTRGAREEIRAALRGRGYRETADFWMAG